MRNLPMDKLDIHLQDKIYNYYWERRFYTETIIPLRNIKIHVQQFILFIRRHILHNINSSITSYKYYLKRYNKILETVCNDKGLLMYLRKDCPFLRGLKHNIEAYQTIAPTYCFVLKYILSKSGAMRYHIVEKFRNLET